MAKHEVMEDNFRRLFEPYHIGNVKLKNRIVKAPFCTAMSDKDGFVTDALISCYQAIAKGGAGLSIVEGTVVDPMGISGCPRLAVHSDRYIPGLNRLARTIQHYGCPAILQLQHAGPAYSPGFYKGKKIIPQETVQPIASSSLTNDEVPMPVKQLPRGLSIPEIQEIEEKFTQSAARAQEAGFDGVELHAAHQYLLSSFLSRAWNRRTDIYGGKIENRVRLLVDIIQGIKARTGNDFLVGARLNGTEYGSPRGLSIEETLVISACLQDAGIDYLSISGWGFGSYSHLCNLPEQIFYPVLTDHLSKLAPKLIKPGIFVESADRIKQSVKVPVITVGRINPHLAEWILENEKADLVAFARNLIADPELPNKIQSGNISLIAPCTACLTCWNSLEKGEHLRCRINPSIGREKEYKIIPATQRKKVMVIGGGPSGLEAARISAMRGHDVHLFEKSNKLGGLLNLASLVKGNLVEDLMAIVQYYKNDLSRHGVSIYLKKKLTLKLIEKHKPDVIILATGSKLVNDVPPELISGTIIYSSTLKKLADIAIHIFGIRFLKFITKNRLPTRKKIIIAGGTIQGLEMASFMLKRKKDITILESSDDLGDGIPDIMKRRLLDWMISQNVIIRTSIKYKNFTRRGIKVLDKHNNNIFYQANHVLVISRSIPSCPQIHFVKQSVSEFHCVGDNNKPGLIVDAIRDGRLVALTI